MERISVFGDVESFLDDPPRVGERKGQWAPTPLRYSFVSVMSSVLIVTHPAIADLNLTMKLNKPFMLPAVLRAVASAAEDENHGILSLQFRELPAFRGVVGELIIGEDSPWDYVGSHMKSSSIFSCTLPGILEIDYRVFLRARAANQ